MGVEGEPRFDIFTQEVRLASKGNDRFQWTLGAFYRDAETSTTASATLTPALLPPGFPLLSSEGTNPADSRSWAVFGEVSYDILPNLNALVGLRYFEDRRRQDSISTVFGATSVDIGRGNFHALSPRFNLSWRPSARVNLYANVAKGFRSGGFNSAAAGAGLVAVPPTYDPDTLWSYEVGGKFQSADRKVSLELAGYRNAWTGVQTTTNVAGLPISFTSNGGKISGWGADGSLNYSPTDTLTLGLTASWNDMEYKSDSAEHLAGDRADYVPRFTGSAFAEYRFTLGDLPSFARVDYQYSSRFQVFLRNFQVAPGFSDEQDILNARIGVSGGSWTAAAFVRNLLNRDSVIYPAIATLPYPARLEPRAAGVMFSVKY